MNRAILTPPPKCLSKEIKDNPKKTPQRDEAHIRHNRRNITLLDNPRRDELGESIAPDVLVDGDGDH